MPLWLQALFPLTSHGVFAPDDLCRLIVLAHNSKYQFFEKYNTLALEIFEKVIELDSDFVLGHTNRVVCLNNLRKFEDALSYIDDIVKQFPYNPIAWNKPGFQTASDSSLTY